MITALLLAVAAHAVDPTNPVTSCDRFIAPETRKSCESKLAALQPDWYLATVCEKQFDDSAFFDCMNLSKDMNFPPEKLDRCDAKSLADEARLSCLREVAKDSKPQEIFQPVQMAPRKPATSLPEKPHFAR